MTRNKVDIHYCFFFFFLIYFCLKIEEIEILYKSFDEDGIGFISYDRTLAFYVILLRIGIEKTTSGFWDSFE